MDDTTRAALRKVTRRFEAYMMKREREFAEYKLNVTEYKRNFDSNFLIAETRLPILDDIVGHLGTMESLPCSEKIVRIRGYIASSRLCGVDSYKFPARQIESILQAIFIFHEHGDPLVGIYCQASMLAMAAILGAYGIRWRTCALLSTSLDTKKETIHSHAVLEVFNDDEKKWELHDPTMDYGFMTLTKGNCYKKISSLELLHIKNKALEILPGENFKRLVPFTCVKKEYLYHMKDIVVTDYLSLRSAGFINIRKVDLTTRFKSMEYRNVVEFINYIYRKPRLVAIDNGQLFTLPDLAEGFEFDAVYGN